MRNPDGNYRNSNTLRTSEYMVSLKTYYGHEIEMYTVEQGEKRDKRQ